MLKKYGIIIVSLFMSVLAEAQAPGGIPYGEPQKVNFNLFNTILLIVIPVLLVVFYFWYRNRKKKK